MANLLTVSEVADYLRTTTTTIYRWLKEGKLSAIKIGKEWRIDETSLNSFLSQQKNRMDISVPIWSEFNPNEHLMVITSSKKDIYEFEASFFKQALKEGAKIFKGCWWQDEDEVLEHYSRLGLDASSLVKENILTVVNLGKSYKKDGLEGPVNAWQNQIRKMTSNGDNRLWASGSPDLLCCGNDCNNLLLFEAKLNEAIKNMPVIGACPYSLEDDCSLENFDKMISLMSHHSGVVFFSNGLSTLLRN